MPLELMQGTGQGMRIVREERRMLGCQGQLGVKQHTGRDPAVESKGCGWYQGTGTGIKSGHRWIQIRQKGRVKRRPDGDIRPWAFGARWTWSATTLGPGRLAALAPLARSIIPLSRVLPFPMVVGRVRRIRSNHVQQLVLVVHEVGGGVRRAPLVRRRWSTRCQTGTAARYCQQRLPSATTTRS